MKKMAKNVTFKEGDKVQFKADSPLKINYPDIYTVSGTKRVGLGEIEIVGHHQRVELKENREEFAGSHFELA